MKKHVPNGIDADSGTSNDKLADTRVLNILFEVRTYELELVYEPTVFEILVMCDFE